MKQQLKSIKLISIGLTAGILFYTFIVLLSTGFTHQPTNIDTIGIMALSIAVAGSLASRLIGNSLLKKTDKSKPLEDQLKQYSRTQIIRLALLEGPALFAVANVMTSGNYEYFIAAGFLIAQMISFFPHTARLTAELQLTVEEQEELFN